MNHSGNQEHIEQDNQDPNQNIKAGDGLHLLMMLLCCLVPLIAIFFLGTTGLSDNIRNWFPLLMIAFCIVPHLFMINHSHTK